MAHQDNGCFFDKVNVQYDIGVDLNREREREREWKRESSKPAH